MEFHLHFAERERLVAGRPLHNGCDVCFLVLRQRARVCVFQVAGEETSGRSRFLIHGACGPACRGIADQLFAIGSRRRREGQQHQRNDSIDGYPFLNLSMSSVFPPTSVSRKSRPRWGYVSFV